MPHMMAWLTILVELTAGVAILAGAFGALFSVAMLAVLLVAMFTVHIQYGFTSIKLLAVTARGPKFGPPGTETDVLYIACIAVLLLLGAGPWSVDHWLASRSRRA